MSEEKDFKNGESDDLLISWMKKLSEGVAIVTSVIYLISENVKKWVDKILDWKTYIPKMKKNNQFIDLNPIEFEVDREIYFDISTEIKEELQDFLDFNQDYLNQELVKQLNKIFNWKFYKYDILNSMTSDLDENQEVYEELLEILDKIDDEIKRK